jgi:hypothetical protein
MRELRGKIEYENIGRPYPLHKNSGITYEKATHLLGVNNTPTDTYTRHHGLYWNYATQT